MKCVKSLVLFSVLVFIGWLWSAANAAEHNQRKSAPQKGAQQGNIHRGSPERGRQMHPGDRGHLGNRRGFERRWPGPGGRPEHFNFRGRHYGSFTLHERTIWHRGAWRHTGHGWYWIVGGVYYSYPAPIYPYPLFVSGVVVEYPVVAPVPVVVARPPLVVQPQAQYWYHCDDPPGYSPYVQNCNTEWRMVPVPPQAPPPPPN